MLATAATYMTPSEHSKCAALLAMCNNAKLRGKCSDIDASHGAPHFWVDIAIDSEARGVEVPTRRFVALSNQNACFETLASSTNAQLCGERNSASPRPATRSFPTLRRVQPMSTYV
jgi:hypothetical protein